jgi:hypothetical protein
VPVVLAVPSFNDVTFVSWNLLGALLALHDDRLPMMA